ncbi:hypothetical protein ACFXTO_044459 [Malus domestica]
MVDTTTGHEALSFMDNASGYNQIYMAPEDEELTTFRTSKGIYYYKVMPFGLKNVGVTYQRAMQKIFNNMLHKNEECYVEDVVVKTKKVIRSLERFTNSVQPTTTLQPQNEPVEVCIWRHFWDVPRLHCQAP